MKGNKQRGLQVEVLLYGQRLRKIRGTITNMKALIDELDSSEYRLAKHKFVNGWKDELEIAAKRMFIAAGGHPK